MFEREMNAKQRNVLICHVKLLIVGNIKNNPQDCLIGAFRSPHSALIKPLSLIYCSNTSSNMSNVASINHGASTVKYSTVHKDYLPLSQGPFDPFCRRYADPYFLYLTQLHLALPG